MGGNPNFWVASVRPSGFVEVGLFVELVHHEQFLTAWKSVRYILTMQDSWKTCLQRWLPWFFLVKYLLHSTYIIAAWPQFDLNFLPILIDTEKLNYTQCHYSILCQYLNLTVFRYLPLEIKLVCLKSCISPSCHLRTLSIIPGCCYMTCICYYLMCLFEVLP